MEIYYTKKEYNEMKSALTRKCKSLEKEVDKLNKKLKEVKQDYEILLETANEKTDELSRN